MSVELRNSFRVDDYAMRYSVFMPRLYNFCLSLGMEPDKMMPSRAFCSDENQGYPIIMIAKHFGTFPFNHGRVGGIVATDRHGPHAHHGEDLVIIQASHVGYEPETGEFGIYRRLQTEEHECSTDCGAICNVIDWYKREYDFACAQIKLDFIDGEHLVVIDNQLVSDEREEGLLLNFERLIDMERGLEAPVGQLSTARVYRASGEYVKRVGKMWPTYRKAIGRNLFPDLFTFHRDMGSNIDASRRINRNLIKSMPTILCSKFPPLSAAQVNVQVEFDRTFRSIVNEPAYRGKWVVFISGIHIDVSPSEGQIFPHTKYVPWAAYVQNDAGEGYTLEQDELFRVLANQSSENPNKIDLTEVIGNMKRDAEIKIRADEA
ncbi:hypothetical protein [Candidatus Reidiella endopervernicosa]|uniref:Limiting CO2-inducible protein B/C beta carbonyic anhydrase domain-containing protein n=1 Tax=Candidatus Reidiella endopervernicosa TaxID=2738883 RepID=A0A6N0HZM1_9GAMM|nr:hypothetical protein [Candidatus Reidiella endopervernicosa]QKQ27769.1 hypothetical protein HUE57_16880 [Candidatus Reidiella endopervernicosa]